MRLLKTVLGERERQIIIMRYGLFGQKAKTQREAADLLGISRSYVSRIEKKALQELKNRFAAFLDKNADNIYRCSLCG